MLSFDRRTLIALLPAVLVAGCGFRPVYKAGSAARGVQGNIRFDLIDSPEGFILLEALERRFGRPRPDARYRAALDLSITETELTLVASSGLARHTLSGKISVSIVDSKSGARVFSQSMRDTAGYTSSAETLMNETARQDARKRLALALAALVSRQIAVDSVTWPT